MAQAPSARTATTRTPVPTVRHGARGRTAGVGPWTAEIWCSLTRLSSTHSALADQHVFGVESAVDEHAIVGGLEAVGDLEGQSQRALDGQ